MKTRKRIPQRLSRERQRLLDAYRQIVNSVREARSMQSVLEKEYQMRRLMRFLHRAEFS